MGSAAPIDHATACSGHPIVSERSIDQSRRLRVVYVGAGISGITAALFFQQAKLNISLAVYEKNPEVGGTWYENRYPGCACDIPAHAYQLSSESSLHWSKFYASSDEILEYWLAVVKKHDLRKYMHFNQKCIEARWNEATSKWHIKFQNTNTGDVIEEVADVFINGTGGLNTWKWPDIKGLHDFKGTLLHSAKWDRSVDLKDKSIAVIGAGSSGIQIVAAIEPIVKSMDHYVRGRTWISTPFVADLIWERTHNHGDTNFEYTQEEKAKWKKEPATYIKYRKTIELGLQSGFDVTHSDSTVSKDATAFFRATMTRKLSSKPEIIDHLIPDFPPGCKRLTPGPGYLEALTSQNVNVIPQEISHIDAHGIVTIDGKRRVVDIIACATGFDTTFVSQFPILGKNGENLQDRYRIKPETYLSVCTDGFPNFLQSFGPNSALGHGNLLAVFEAVQHYFTSILHKLTTSNIKTFEPRREAVLDFDQYCEAYFKRTVFSAECNSWYKQSPPGTSAEKRKKGRVVALWPGSSMHAIKTFSSVRWEDYKMTYTDGNRFGWIGNGWTEAERNTDVEEITACINNTSFLHEPLKPDCTSKDTADVVENSEVVLRGGMIPG